MGLDLTVAICTHDHADMLERTLERLARQRADGASWELLVVDNRSGDRTPEVIREWSARGVLPSMRSIREERLGLRHARLAAIEAARSDLIAFVDDDCLLDEGWVAAAVAFARARPRAGAFGGRVELRWEAPPTPAAEVSAWALARQARGDLPERLVAHGGASLVGAGLVVRRAALRASGWLDDAQMMGRRGKLLTAGDDAEIGLRIRAAGWELWYDPAMRLEHAIPATRMSLGYLRRLHRGIGQTAPYIAIVSGEHRRGALSGAYFCYRGLAKAASKALQAAAQLARGRRRRALERWLMAHYWYGCFEGGLRLARPAASPRRGPEGGATGSRA